MENFHTNLKFPIILTDLAIVSWLHEIMMVGIRVQEYNDIIP